MKKIKKYLNTMGWIRYNGKPDYTEIIIDIISITGIIILTIILIKFI